MISKSFLGTNLSNVSFIQLTIFLVILVAKTADDALERVNLIIDRLNRRILSVPKINYAVTASFGVTQLQARDDEKTALSRADIALYRAKTNGRNQLQVDGV